MFNIHELIILTRGICIRRFPIGAIQYLPVTSLLEWEIPVKGIKFANKIITPPTSFIIGNEEYIMPAKDLAFQRINNTNNCITGTQGGELDDQWLLGDTFIKVYIYIISHAKGLL